MSEQSVIPFVVFYISSDDIWSAVRSTWSPPFITANKWHYETDMTYARAVIQASTEAEAIEIGKRLKAAAEAVANATARTKTAGDICDVLHKLEEKNNGQL